MIELTEKEKIRFKYARMYEAYLIRQQEKKQINSLTKIKLCLKKLFC